MLFLSAGATTVVAQDATNCNSNSSISHEAVRAGNFKDAYTPWKAVLENCPTLRFYTFTDGYKILKGLMGRSYLSHIKYRLGAYYTTPYYKIGGKEATREYGVTAGFGLPVPRSRSILSISGQFVRISGQEAAFVNENIFRVSIGLTFNERWFFKRRVE